MKVQSISVVRKELQNLEKDELLDLCLKLSKFSTTNKEFLSYLLFYNGLDSDFLKEVKSTISIHFEELNGRNAFWAKKTLRKIIRIIKKYAQYSPSKEVEIELRIHFCHLFMKKKLYRISDQALQNIYEREIEKIKKLISKLHEDLQHDYLKLLSENI